MRRTAKRGPQAGSLSGSARGGVSRILWRPLRWVGIRLAKLGLALVLLLAVWIGLYRVVPPPGGAYMAAEWWRLGSIERDWVAIEQISPDLSRAVIAAEDARFCAHWGIDLEAVAAALAANAEGGRVVGASTITQQVAKNVFLWPTRSWLRKGLEAGLAVMIEALWPKRRILEVYLNVAEFDAGVFGAEAAARHHFGIPARELSLAQAARLAAVLPNPKGRSALRPSPRMRARAQAIAEGSRTLAATGGAACARPG